MALQSFSLDRATMLLILAILVLVAIILIPHCCRISNEFNTPKLPVEASILRTYDQEPMAV
jgi:hypothetical protein